MRQIRSDQNGSDLIKSSWRWCRRPGQSAPAWWSRRRCGVGSVCGGGQGLATGTQRTKPRQPRSQILSRRRMPPVATAPITSASHSPGGAVGRRREGAHSWKVEVHFTWYHRPQPAYPHSVCKSETFDSPRRAVGRRRERAHSWKVEVHFTWYHRPRNSAGRQPKAGGCLVTGSHESGAGDVAGRAVGAEAGQAVCVVWYVCETVCVRLKCGLGAGLLFVFRCRSHANHSIQLSANESCDSPACARRR